MKKFKNIFNENKCFIIFLIVFVITRFIFLNINYTEWGDTFRMIRGADYLSHGLWPWDEKRWPFYSLLLVPGIWLNSVILWGRVLSFLISISTAIIIYLFYKKHFDKDKSFALAAVVLTVTSSVFAYWSFRVMADPVFAFLILLYSYLFIEFYSAKTKKKISIGKVTVLSILLLMITMTRLEGLFIGVGTGIFLLLDRRWRDIVIFALPQVLVYFPFTLYAKVLYQGEVQNDYLNEVQTFVFDLDRFVYFFAYTAFILVIPIFLYFIISGSNNLRKEYKKKNWFVYIPVLTFIVLELIIGFIWTPSLPRIYLPIIPFLMMVAVYGIQKTNFSNKKLLTAFLMLLPILVFTVLQYQMKLYFLGASKVLFALIIVLSVFSIFVIFFKKNFHFFLIAILVFTNILISFTVISNQKYIYKTVKEGIDYVLDAGGKTAYSDETGNTEWYLKENGFYLNQNNQSPQDITFQYDLLKENDVQHLLWTNEFNRGSTFLDPKADNRFTLEAVYREPIRDQLTYMLEKIGLLESSGFVMFETKVYKVN